MVELNTSKGGGSFMVELNTSYSGRFVGFGDHASAGSAAKRVIAATNFAPREHAKFEI